MTPPEPAVPEPDDKDWTWTLRERCPDCGFDPSTVAPADLGPELRRCAITWTAALAEDDVRQRPAPTTWSSLEYGAHVRDVMLLFRRRVLAMLTTDDPLFDNWDQDATALEGRYWEADPGQVAEELAAATDLLAAVYDGVADDQWDRPGRRSNGSVFTVASLGVYCLHDVVHHLHDVGR